MSLTELAIRAAKPAQKPYKVYDERGLSISHDPVRLPGTHKM